MDRSFFNKLIWGKGNQEQPGATITAGAPIREPSQALDRRSTENGLDPIHGWVAAGRDPRTVMTGGLMGGSTLFR